MILWSILVPMIGQRLAGNGQRLILDLAEQGAGRAVEVLGFYDNQKRSVGEKRNALLQMARGLYVSFVDDDDTVAPSYCDDILRAIQAQLGVDVICFQQHVSINGMGPKLCQYSLANTERRENVNGWWGPPAHTMVWRRELVAAIPFPNRNYGEDMGWVDRACGLAKTEAQIPRVLYHYRFSSTGTQTRTAQQVGRPSQGQAR